ncbi:DUF2786 domain-containing protein [Microbacterium sp. NPDC089987]|uniref:DUF2786 domain-containing protein n=1 Tax=Microbacterium sp. NPDC089987 TaxID=3364202 RepID=UPI00382D3EF1
MHESKLDLIAKLLAKAERTTPEEAEALTEHAERLMLKYGIDQARLDEKRSRLGQDREQIVTELMPFDGTYARDMRELGAGVVHALGAVRPLYASGRSGRIGPSLLYLVGYASDVHQAKVLITSLQMQAMVAMRAWWVGERHRRWHDTEGDRRRARSGFIRGFGVGAAERIRESRMRIIDDAGPGTDLVLASRLERVDAAVGEMSTRRARQRDGADAGSFYSGRRSGREANTGGRAMRGHVDGT